MAKISPNLKLFYVIGSKDIYVNTYFLEINMINPVRNTVAPAYGELGTTVLGDRPDVTKLLL